MGMKTEEMICELRRLEEAHKNDFVGTCETNWSLMCRDVANRLEELLAAQEPRVMTPEEVIALPDYTVVWLEDNDKSDVISGIVNYVWKNHLCSFTVIDMREVHADIASYGTDWRCWTSRPDQATREATPWN